MAVKYVNSLKGWSILYDGSRPRLMYKRGRVIQFYDVERNDPLYIVLKEREETKKKKEEEMKEKKLMEVKVLERDYTFDRCEVLQSNTEKVKRGEVVYVVYHGKGKISVYNDSDEELFSNIDTDLIERDFSEMIVYD